MKIYLQIILGAFLFCFIVIQDGKAQYTSKKVKSKHQLYTDSLKQVEYNYLFPIWGQQAYKNGFDIPYPMGVMTNFIWMDQGLLINNMQLGLNTNNLDIPLTAIDFIEFGDNTNTSYMINVRPDVWILPFLNVYGLFGAGRSHTEVFLTAPVNMKSVVDQGVRTNGFGIMGAGGIGPVWFSVDANFTWNKPELVEDPTRVNVLGIRLGHTFLSKNRPDRNFAIWVGGMRMKMSTETIGAIKMADALPQEVWDRKDEIVGSYWDWYNGLDPTKPADALMIKKADDVLSPIIENIDERNGEAVIAYGMDKQTKNLWNGVIGLQYQLNKSWQFRTEGGLVGDRKSFMISVNYRFLGI